MCGGGCTRTVAAPRMSCGDVSTHHYVFRAGLLCVMSNHDYVGTRCLREGKYGDCRHDDDDW